VTSTGIVPFPVFKDPSALPSTAGGLRGIIHFLSVTFADAGRQRVAGLYRRDIGVHPAGNAYAAGHHMSHLAGRNLGSIQLRPRPSLPDAASTF
jgi:hypothetical protein